MGPPGSPGRDGPPGPPGRIEREAAGDTNQQRSGVDRFFAAIKGMEDKEDEALVLLDKISTAIASLSSQQVASRRQDQRYYTTLANGDVLFLYIDSSQR